MFRFILVYKFSFVFMFLSKVWFSRMSAELIATPFVVDEHRFEAKAFFFKKSNSIPAQH